MWILRCCLKLNRFELINSPQTGQHLSSDLEKDKMLITMTCVIMLVSKDSPVIVHVDVKVVQAGQHGIALDAVDGPHVILYLVLVFAHRGVARS